MKLYKIKHWTKEILPGFQILGHIFTVIAVILVFWQVAINKGLAQNEIDSRIQREKISRTQKIISSTILSTSRFSDISKAKGIDTILIEYIRYHKSSVIAAYNIGILLDNNMLDEKMIYKFICRQKLDKYDETAYGFLKIKSYSKMTKEEKIEFDSLSKHISSHKYYLDVLKEFIKKMDALELKYDELE